MSEKLEDFYTKIEKNFPSDRDKSEIICTMLGSSANLTEFIMANIDVSSIPMAIQYCILITSMNMISMLNDDVILEKVDLSEELDFKFSEQTQEHIYRKMKKAVDLIVENFKKYEEEYGI